MNTRLGKKVKIDFEKDFFELMNNSFWKTIRKILGNIEILSL